MLLRSVLWASADSDSARTNAAAVAIVLTEFIGLDLLVAAHHGQPSASDSVPMYSIPEKLIHGPKLGREIRAIAPARQRP